MLYSVSINGKDMMDYGLILLADITIPKAKPRRTPIVVPGADGDIDDSTAVTGEPTYDAIDINFTLFKGTDDRELDSLCSRLCNEYNGREVRVIFPIDPSHYYKGILSVGQISGYNSGRIPMSLHANPWKWKHDPTTVTRSDLSTGFKALTLSNERKTVVPTITVTRETVLHFGAYEVTAGPGEHRYPAIALKAGDNDLQARVTSGRGAITVTYQEAGQ